MSRIACLARRAAPAVTALTALLLASASIAAAPATAAPATAAAATPRALVRVGAAGRVMYRRACPAPARGQVACLAIVDTNTAGRPLTRAQATAAGLHPYTAADLQSAYHLPSALLGGRQTIAIVDPFDDPNAAADLAVYRAAGHLPPCTTANGCFTKVNQRGQRGGYPAPDPGWAEEESLDLDMASAACPNCHLLLVEASTANLSNILPAADEAARLGADVISNSYGTNTEYAGENTDCQHYHHPGVAITASAGDDGFGVIFPAVCPAVTAAGGTALYRNTSARRWGETAWPGTGSGCSAYIPKPAWQHGPLCGTRTTADVAAVADPATPVAVYDTYGGDPGWEAFGGTSVAAPLIAAVYALAGNTATIGPGASHLYSHHTDLYDITTGTNGTCGGSYLCTAVNGYDGPTGWGTPHGIGAF
jgi:subtilase family serine protease